MKIQELDDGQAAYRDSEGNLMVLPLDNDEVREAFIHRLTLEYVEERSAEELLERFKQSIQEAKSGDTIDKEGDD